MTQLDCSATCVEVNPKLCTSDVNAYFSEVESDFYRFLTADADIGVRARTNYMSWLRFLSETYPLAANLTEDDVDEIIANENILRLDRNKYTKPTDMANFKSALHKYCVFLNSDFRKQQEDTLLADIKKIETDTTISETERSVLTKARVGQGKFREELISYWHGCSISAYSRYEILIASHIRPWKKADNFQRLDVFNGLLLLPNYDKLFDKGYISFGDNGKIIYSTYLSLSDRVLLGMDDSIRLLRLDDKHKQYLAYHRDNCLMR